MAKAKIFGFNPPFFSDKGVMPIQADERIIKNDLLQLLLTTPGERAFRPTFGTTIKSSLFEQIDDYSTEILKGSIIDSIALFEPRVTATQVFVETRPDDNIISIKIFCQLTVDPNRTFELELNLPGPNISQTPSR